MDTEKQPDEHSGSSHGSSSADIAFAMRALAGDISSPDYVPIAACIEAADRIDALSDAVAKLHDLLHRANATFIPSNDGACEQIAKTLRETAWLVEKGNA